MSGDTAPSLQYAALPYRRRAGGLEVMLITSRDTGRWLVPKGWPAPSLEPRDSAAREALEEGGLVGQVSAQPLGFYRYGKRLDDGSTVDCTVQVFGLEVERQENSWPEKDQRRCRWLPLQEAAAAVDERELSEIILNLARLVG